MRQNRYYDAISDEQNQETYWEGVKNGALAGVIVTLVLVGHGIRMIHKIKESKK